MAKRKSHNEKTVGPWAEDKLAALEKYLRYYCLYLSKKSLTLVYIDGFAGAPITQLRTKSDEQPTVGLWGPEDDAARDRYVHGSPIRALETNPGFHRHYFFDLDQGRVDDLEKLKLRFPEKWIHVEVGDANERIRKLVSKIHGRRDVKGVAFLDPYKDNLEWETVLALADTRAFEVIINLPLHMAINRMLLKSGERNADWEARIDKCFGTRDWRPLVYPETVDLFGELSAPKADRVPQVLLEFYVRRLKAAFGEAASPREIQNTHGSPLYYLIWAGPHQAGLKGAEYILGSGERLAAKRRG